MESSRLNFQTEDKTIDLFFNSVYELGLLDDSDMLEVLWKSNNNFSVEDKMTITLMIISDRHLQRLADIAKREF